VKRASSGEPSPALLEGFEERQEAARMNHNPQCDQFPDIYQTPPPKDDPEYENVKAANELHEKVYKASRYILVNNFSPPLKQKIPEEPKDFPGNPGTLTDQEIAMMASVHGLLIADNWEPTMGKLRPAPGDLNIDLGGNRMMVVDRRFVEATVAAVQEYTSQSKLFDRAFEQLKAEAVQTSTGTGTVYTPGVSSPPMQHPAEAMSNVGKKFKAGAQPDNP
jgi:hypothetical protein